MNSEVLLTHQMMQGAARRGGTRARRRQQYVVLGVALLNTYIAPCIIGVHVFFFSIGSRGVIFVLEGAGTGIHDSGDI